MAFRSLQGIVPPLVTPFREDERIDCNAWQIIIDMLIGAGVDGLFTGGSQGEFYALDPEERTMALRFCRQATAGRVPLFGNVGAVTTRETIRLAAQAEALGVDYLVVVTPYYIQPSRDELAEHYIDVCRAVRAPVLAYNYPHHGGVVLTPEVIARVAARCENFVGMKDSGGDLAQTVAFRKAVTGRPFAVFNAHDHLVVSSLERGCAGAMVASANVAPRLYIELYRAVREGKKEEAARLQALAAELGAVVGLHTFPSVVKEAMGMVGYPAGPCRRPVSRLPAEARAAVSRVLERLGREGYLPKALKSLSA